MRLSDTPTSKCSDEAQPSEVEERVQKRRLEMRLICDGPMEKNHHHRNPAVQVWYNQVAVSVGEQYTLATIAYQVGEKRRS
jgi:hypothetical protein